MEGEQDGISLYDSRICRLCAEENTNGYALFCNDGSEPDLSVLINSYLPVKPKLADDGKFPNWICPGCHLQVESTVQFFDLVVYGQETLKDLCIKNELAQKMSEKRIVNQPRAELGGKKRGRPAKPVPVATDTLENKNPDENVTNETKSALVEHSNVVTTGRQRRKIKIPSRYRGSVQGKELDFIETGVVEQNDFASDVDEAVREFAAGTENQTVYPVEVIGHLQDNNGANLGDLVVINNKVTNMYRKSKLRKTRFMCDVCKMCFAYEQQFLLHRFSHQNVKFECTQCLKCFLDRDTLFLHQSETLHNGEGIIECIEQSIALGDEPLTRHAADISNTVQENICQSPNITIYAEECYKEEEIVGQTCNVYYADNVSPGKKIESSNNLGRLSENMASESTMRNEEQTSDYQSEQISNCQETASKPSTKRLRYHCNICSCKFTRMQFYLYHRETEHNDGRRFVCSKCKKCFKSKAILQRHQLVHSNARPFSCSYCNASFKTSTHLFYHKRSHTGEKKHRCDVCQQLFAHKNSLTLHMRSHTGFKPYKCSVCDKTFTQHGNMQEHLRIHTGECPFECPSCGRKFKTSSQVRMHVKRHAVDKPLKCNICDKSFVQIVELRNHQRRHNNVKPYGCEVCGKFFVDSSALKKHLRLHTGEKPYICDECPRRFADRSNLKKHLKVHQNKRKDMESWRELNNSNKEGLMESLNEFNSTSAVDQHNLELSGTLSNSLADDCSMWDLIEEDVYLDGNNSPCLASKGIVGGNQQLVNITYQDPDNPLISKTTLFVVQNATDPLTNNVNHLENSVAMQESCTNDQLLQSSNVFLTNQQGDTNEIQTVFLNIQNPVNIQLQHACEVFNGENATESGMELITSEQ